MSAQTGTRKTLGIEFGDVVTIATDRYGDLTGTVIRAHAGMWALEGHPAYAARFGAATRVTLITTEGNA